MTEGRPELTRDLLEAALAKADARVCAGSPRCFTLADPLHAARASCTADGRRKVGWITREGGQERSDVWLEIRTGLVERIPQQE